MTENMKLSADEEKKKFLNLMTDSNYSVSKFDTRYYQILHNEKPSKKETDKTYMMTHMAWVFCIFVHM